MAHQTDVHIVKQTFEPENPGETVVDPACGKAIERRASRHMLFKGDEAIYFCSLECEQRYLDPAFKVTAPKRAA